MEQKNLKERGMGSRKGREGNADRDGGVEKQRHEAGMRVKNRGQRVGREQHRQPGIRERANKRSEGRGNEVGKKAPKR